MQFYKLAGFLDELEKMGASYRNAGYLQSRRGIRPIRVDTLINRTSSVTEPEQVAQNPELDQPPAAMASEEDSGEASIGKTAGEKTEKAMHGFVRARPYASSALGAAVPAALLGGIYGGPRAAKTFGTVGGVLGLANQGLKDWAKAHKRKGVAKAILEEQK